MRLWLLHGGGPEDAPAVRAFLLSLGAGATLLHPTFSDRAALDFGPVDSRALGVDLAPMNSPIEERAFRDADAFAQTAAEALGPVPFRGVDLAACLPNLLDLRLEAVLTLAGALDALRAERVSPTHVVVWLKSFSRAHMAILLRGAELGLCDPEAALLGVAAGHVAPTPALWMRHSVSGAGGRVLARLQAAPVDRRADAAPPAGGDLTIMALSHGRGYLEELADILAALDDGESYRLLVGDDRILEDLRLACGGRLPLKARPAVLAPAGAEQTALDPAGVARAVGAVFDRLAGWRPPEAAEKSIAGGVLRHLPAACEHASAYRRAFRFCAAVERLAARLGADDARRLFFYPSRTPLDPAPQQLMRARGGASATALARSITTHFRNFYLPRADALATLGAAQTAAAEARGFPPERAIAVGSLQADAGFARAPRRQRAGAPPSILVATSGFDRVGEATWVPALAAAARRAPGLRVTLRPHPAIGVAAYRPLIGPDDDAVRIHAGADLYAAIAAADAVVTDVSHVGKLALYRGAPLAIANLSGAPFPFNRFDEAGLATLLDSVGKVSAFAEAARAGGLAPPPPARRATFIAEEFHADDGASPARFRAFLAGLRRDRETRVRAPSSASEASRQGADAPRPQNGETP